MRVELRFERVDVNEFEVFLATEPRDEFLGWMRTDRFGVWRFKSTDDSICVTLCPNEEIAKYRLAASLTALRGAKDRARDSPAPE